jgi:hypothetical protein
MRFARARSSGERSEIRAGRFVILRSVVIR